MLATAHIRSYAGDEAGFTLMEVLVSMMTALIITLAAFGLLQVVTEQSSRATDYVQASERGGTAMTHIIDELHSACFVPKITPVVETSGPTTLIFETAYSSESEPTASQVQEHEIKWEAETKRTGQVTEMGKLVDYTYVGEGTYPSYKFHAKPNWTKKTLIGEHIATLTEGSESGIFKYYKYSPEAQQSSATALGSFTQLPATLGATEAAQAASVVIGFRQFPSDGSELPGRSVVMKSQATFAFGAPIAEPKIVDAPCE
jgi:Tfp pilus assembly protein PilW